MEKSRGTKKTLKTALTLMALVAALATTGCTGSSLMGPEKGTQVQAQTTSQEAGREPNMTGREANP